MTNQKITFNSLDSYFLNTATGKLNSGYLNDQIYMQLDIVWRHTNSGNGKSRLQNELMNKRRKASSLVWQAFLEFTNEAIKQEYSGNYQATSGHLKKYLEKYGLNYDALQPVIDEVERMRREYMEEVDK